MSNECLELDVPGFKVSQQPSQKPALRAIWYLTFVVCSFVSLRMVIERANYYFSYPTILTFAPPEIEPFPNITFCPILEYFRPSTEKPPFYSTISKCESSVGIQDCKQPELWTSHPSVYGTAYTFNLEKAYNSSISFAKFQADFENDFKNLFMNADDAEWKLLLHDHDDDITYGCVTSAIDIDPDTETRLIYMRKKTIYENVPARPCQSPSEHRKCSLRCLDRIFTRINPDENCRLDYMTTVDDLPLCNIYIAMNMEWDIGHLLETKNMNDECACVKACEKSRLELDIDTDENEGQVVVSIARGPEWTEVLREKMSYTGYSLLCEVGGIIGFYLGACLITFIQVIQHLTTRLYAHVNAPKGSPYVQKHMAHSKDCPCCNQPLPT